MSVCESVSILADEVEASLVEPSESQIARLNILKKMPEYLSNMRLDLFDQAFTSTYQDDEDEETVNFKAIEVVRELAFENMYVAFSKKDTRKTYKWLIVELKKLGIQVSTNLDMSAL